MMLKIFKGTGPGVIFLIAVTMVCVWISAFVYPGLPGRELYETSPMPLYALVKLITGSHPLPGVIISFLILTIIMFLLVNFNTSVFFINERTFVPALMYILISGIFPQYQLINPIFPAVLFLIMAIRRIMDSYRKPGIAFNYFDAGILISTGSLFYANLIWYGLIVFIGIILLRTGNLKEIFISILGLITPFLIVTGIYYVFNMDIPAFFEDIKVNLFNERPSFTVNRITVIVIIYIGLCTIVSMVFLIRSMSSKKIRSRKTFYLLFWILIISLILFFVVPSVSAEMIFIAGIPVSYFLVHFFIFAKRKTLIEVIFSLLIVFILLIQVLYLFGL